MVRSKGETGKKGGTVVGESASLSEFQEVVFPMGGGGGGGGEPQGKGGRGKNARSLRLNWDWRNFRTLRERESHLTPLRPALPGQAKEDDNRKRLKGRG